MKKTTKIIDGDRVTIINEKCDYPDDDLAPEYDLSKVNLKPNPYSQRLKSQNKLTVQLDHDISQYFKNSRVVNDYLRKQIKLMQSVVRI
jgi:hypothetical protein